MAMTEEQAYRMGAATGLLLVVVVVVWFSLGFKLGMRTTLVKSSDSDLPENSPGKEVAPSGL
jgi:hypothetical protein